MRYRKPKIRGIGEGLALGCRNGSSAEADGMKTACKSGSDNPDMPGCKPAGGSNWSYCSNGYNDGDCKDGQNANPWSCISGVRAPGICDPTGQNFSPHEPSCYSGGDAEVG